MMSAIVFGRMFAISQDNFFAQIKYKDLSALADSIPVTV